jgi:hypothetical protein
MLFTQLHVTSLLSKYVISSAPCSQISLPSVYIIPLTFKAEARLNNI